MADLYFKKFFYENAATYYLAMGAKKGIRMRKIEALTDSVPELELGEREADIQWRKEEREAREKEEGQQQREEEARREEARVEESHFQVEGVAEKKAQDRQM